MNEKTRVEITKQTLGILGTNNNDSLLIYPIITHGQFKNFRSFFVTCPEEVVKTSFLDEVKLCVFLYSD